MVIARRNLTVKNRLGDRADSGGGRPGAERDSASLAAPTTASTDSDNRLFGKLMPPDQNTAATPPPNPRPPAPAPRALGPGALTRGRSPPSREQAQERPLRKPGEAGAASSLARTAGGGCFEAACPLECALAPSCGRTRPSRRRNRSYSARSPRPKKLRARRSRRRNRRGGRGNESCSAPGHSASPSRSSR